MARNFCSDTFASLPHDLAVYHEAQSITEQAQFALDRECKLRQRIADLEAQGILYVEFQQVAVGKGFYFVGDTNRTYLWVKLPYSWGSNTLNGVVRQLGPDLKVYQRTVANLQATNSPLPAGRQ